MVSLGSFGHGIQQTINMGSKMISLQVDYESTIQTISDVMVNGVLFSCGDEHITTHCKHMEEEVLHDPVKDSSGNPIVYTTLDYKFQIIEYKNHSWMCPALHVSEVSCTKGEGIRKACHKGEFNYEIIPEGGNMQFYYICAQCPEGTYQNDDKFMGTQCTNCPDGTWVDFVGAQAMDRCKKTDEHHDRVYQPLSQQIPDPDHMKDISSKIEEVVPRNIMP